MYEKLKKHFPSLQYYENPPKVMDQQLNWFITANGHVIGIEPSDLEEKDRALLQLFLQPYETIFPAMTEAEKKWQRYIHEDSTQPEANLIYRFIYFQIPPDQLEPSAFKEAMNQLFEKDVIILWESKTKGIIVDTEKDTFLETISLDEIIDILMSDLSVKLKFFVGPYLSTLEKASHYYKKMITQAATAFPYSGHHVVSYLEAVPYYVIDQLTPEVKAELQHLIHEEYLEDKAFIKMVEVFLASNLNISEAAKRLYMHRNSLQYRMEKFHQDTCLDLRNFHHALTVYLALLANR